jgi:transposase
LAAADEKTPLSVVLTAGQRHDTIAFAELLAGVPDECPVELGVGDRAYDSDEVRELLLDRDIGPNIPSKSNRVEPIEHDADVYKERNRVERLVGKLKQFRRVATRYEKLGATFIALVHAVAAFVMIR